jgi:hypothetical protein
MLLNEIQQLPDLVALCLSVRHFLDGDKFERITAFIDVVRALHSVEMHACACTELAEFRKPQPGGIVARLFQQINASFVQDCAPPG